MIGIISDIHGNYPALCAVLDKLDQLNCRKIYCLGDICGYYCMINECIELLLERDVVCIKGNHDSYLLGEQRCPRSRTANICIDYQQKIIKPSYYEWLKSRPNIILTDELCAVHGGWNDYLDEYIEMFSFDSMLLEKYPVKIFMTGHTHKQTVQTNGMIVYGNPGAVGQPRDYLSTAGFAVIEGNEISLKRTIYDIDSISFEMKKAGFTERYYENLYSGTKIGESISKMN